MHREFQPALMGEGHAHPHEAGHEHAHDHDHDAERRALVATTAVVGLLLGADLASAAWGGTAWRPWGVSPALIAAVIGGGRVVYLALLALLEGRIGADIALAVACVAAAVLGENFVAAEDVFIPLVGECLEAFAFGRAQPAIHNRLDLTPPLAGPWQKGRNAT